jgi:hypothetical protein
MIVQQRILKRWVVGAAVVAGSTAGVSIALATTPAGATASAQQSQLQQRVALSGQARQLHGTSAGQPAPGVAST